MSTSKGLSQYLLAGLLGGSGFGCVLVSIRIVWSGSWFYLFLIWNLFLAWIPLIAACVAVRQKKNWVRNLLFFFWLIFFPNAPYIVTDFIHLYYREPIPLWYDLAHLSLFAWLGMWLGFYSLLIIHAWLAERLKKWQSRLVVGAVLSVSGYGIYLGRFLRWNSWDILANPGKLFLDTLARTVNPLEYPTTWGVTAVFGAVLSVLYLIFYVSHSSKEIG